MKFPLQDLLWKWRIALVCGVLHLLHWGLMRTRSFLFVGTIDRFNVNRKEASFPYVLCSIVTHLCGPLAGYLGCRFGLQNVTMLGCVLSSLAAGSCFFAENILGVTILWGILVGIGNGLAGPLTPSIISNYYKKNMSTANGIASTGSAIGIFLYSPLFEYTLRKYTISGTYLVIAALWLNTIPAVMIMKDVPQERRSTTQPPSLKVNCTQVEDISLDTPLTCPEVKFEEKAEMTQINHHQHQSSGTKQDHQSFNSSPNSASVEEVKTMLPKTLSSQKRKTWKAFAVFFDPLFLLVAFTQGSFLALMTLNATISADYFKDRGLDMGDISVLMMVTATGDILGRFSLGWITDKHYMSVTHFASICYFVYGLTYTLNAISKEFYSLLLSNLLGTVAIGALLAVLPSIVFQYFQGEKRTMAMSSRFIMFVPISMTISPLIGFFRETVGSYEGLFHSVNVYCCINCVLLLLMPWVAKKCS